MSYLSAHSSASTTYLLKHQKSCRKKDNQVGKVQSRLAFIPNGSICNWHYKPDVARSNLYLLIARLEFSL